jgi:hypothetical protein
MPARGRKQRIPHRLTVVMRVHVDPARRNHQPRGIDVAPGRSLLAADGGDPAFCNGDVAAECGLAGAIHDRAATNNDVVHANLPNGVSPPRPRRHLLLLICVRRISPGSRAGNLGVVDEVSHPCCDTTPISTTREVGRTLQRTDRSARWEAECPRWVKPGRTL